MTYGIVQMVREEFERAMKCYDELPLQVVHRYLKQKFPDLRYEICMYVAGHSTGWRLGRMYVEGNYGRSWVFAIIRDVPLGEHIVAQGV